MHKTTQYYEKRIKDLEEENATLKEDVNAIDGLIQLYLLAMMNQGNDSA